MESVGQKLRQARLRLGLSLEAVSSRTYINIRSLSAIEEDQLDRISSRFIYKSFVRQVGQVVGLDAGMLEQDLLSAAGSIPEPLVPGQAGSAEAPSLARFKHQRIRVAPWAQSLAWLTLMLIACSALYAVWQRARSHTSTEIVATERPAAATLGSQTSTPQAGPQLSGTPGDGAFHIQLSAIEQTWLSVVTDGKEVYNGILRRAETKTLEGYELTRIRTGNAGAVAVVFNGRKLGPLGSRGQVRTVVFSRNGYEVLQPEADMTTPRIVLASYELASK